MQLQLPVLFSFNLHFSSNSSSLADDVVSGDAFYFYIDPITKLSYILKYKGLKGDW